MADIDFKRAQELRAKNISSAEEFDQKSAAFRQAEAAPERRSRCLRCSPT
jgi:multidrug resistance efflux pump